MSLSRALAGAGPSEWLAVRRMPLVDLLYWCGLQSITAAHRED